jgi:triosephosphate isomerase (TIM)
MRKRIVAGNWKMNLTISEGIKLVDELKRLTSNTSDFSKKERVQYIIAPSFLHLLPLKEICRNSIFNLASQNISDKEKGAYTGEVSAAMLSSIEIDCTIIGHSERRMLYHETNEQIKNKINLALSNALTPIFCCGEPLEIRKDKNEKDFVLRQLNESLFHLTDTQMSKIIIAYEPIWAIGTGQTATAEQAEEMHAFIRNKIAQNYTDELAESMTILYGGSVNAGNADALFSQPNVDGALVGGASLVAKDFFQIMKAVNHK